MILKKYKNIDNNQSIGQIFTPKFVAKFMVLNCLKIIENLRKEKIFWKSNNGIKVLEPSVGRGVFLKYLIQNNLKDINAYEIDESLRFYLLKTYPQVNFIFDNALGADLNEKFDLIIGNPPYLGQNYNAEIFQTYLAKYPICKEFFVGNMDLFYYFVHLGIEKLNPGGILSFITTNYWITKSKKTGIKLLKPHILEECFLLQYIELSNLKLFKGAKGQHNCIFVLQKKSDYQKTENVNNNIQIIHIGRKKNLKDLDEVFNKKIFADLINNKESNYIQRYKSVLTNKHLSCEGNWNLLYPKEVKEIVDKIEYYCSKNGKILFLKDYFLIRNGLILIKDEIFILSEEKDLKIESNGYYIKINNHFSKLNENEKERLKKIYKSKSIKQYNYIHHDYIGYVIYFNKNEFSTLKVSNRNQAYERKYPTLTNYLKQFEIELKDILINAKEKPEDFYFPRRGTFIRKIKEKNNPEGIFDLESSYNKGNKIFFKYISKENIFGYTESSYIATSDTYFLWPRFTGKKIDYLFILAYLNSKLVRFLFRAKNISIKRSKTKLEYGLPIPNQSRFDSEKDIATINIIKFLTSWLTKLNHSNKKLNQNELFKNLSSLSYFSFFNHIDLIPEIKSAFKINDNCVIQRIIDKLFFQLFEVKEKEIDYLINKFYQF